MNDDAARPPARPSPPPAPAPPPSALATPASLPAPTPSLLATLRSPESLAVLLLALALLWAPGRGHVDDLDAQTYRVIVRRMAGGDGFLTPRFLPGYWPAFREHLPFGFWPGALAAKAGGLAAAQAMYLGFSLATVALLLWAGGAIAGGRAGLAAGLLLALTESFWHYGGRVLLDPPLLLLGTASAVPLLLPRAGRREWLLATGLAALACAVKGPFGLGPIACAGAGRALALRSPRVLLQAALATLLAAAPVLLFLAADAAVLHLGWWDGYVRGNVLGRLTGGRTDGVAGFWFATRVLLGRFWPGLPFALLGALQALRPAPATATAGAAGPAGATRAAPVGLRALTWACALLLFALSLPARKWGNTVYLLFPPLALLAGTGLGPWLDALAARSPRLLRGSLAGLAVAASLAAAAGLGRLVLQPPCPLASGLAGPLRALPPGDVLVVAPAPDIALLAEVADETPRTPWPATSLADAPPDRPIAAALVRDGPLPPGWLHLAHARGWTLAVPAQP